VHPKRYPATGQLIDRHEERTALNRLLRALRSGESRVLVLHGVPGVGKTALLEYVRGIAGDVRVLRAAGVQSEMELPFATLHQLCGPLLDRIGHLPAPQREALDTVLGLRAGPAPERFLVGLAVLGLLADASAEGPLLCLLDDAQWFDQPSAQVLGFVARRLPAASVALLFSTRVRGRDLLGLPDLEVTGLGEAGAHALLDSVAHAGLDQHIRDRIVTETGGNPLALLELPRGLGGTDLAGAMGLPGTDPLPQRIEQDLLSRAEGLPEPTRRLLLIAAAEPLGDPILVWRAAARLGIAVTEALSGGTDGLLAVEERVTFRHPLVRSAVYRAASTEQRRAVHLALAEVTDADADPDRRAWHLAAAAAGPDDAVAAELERSAGRAQARGGVAAAAAFLQRAVALSVDPDRRADRAVAAAGVTRQAGDLPTARHYLTVAERGARTEAQRARLELVRGEIAFAAGLGDEAPPLLLTAARRLEPFDVRLSRETYLIAWGTAALLAADANSLPAISRAILALPPHAETEPVLDLVLRGCALLVTGGREAAVAVLRQALPGLPGLPVRDVVKWGWVANAVGPALWDDRAMLATCRRAAEVVRSAGVLTELSFCLASLGVATAGTGDLAGAARTAAESDAVATAAGVPIAPHVQLRLTALRGRRQETIELIDATTEQAVASGRLTGAGHAHWAAAVLHNGCGDHEAAMTAALAAGEAADPSVSVWALPELVEAAARAGFAEVARHALDRLTNAAQPCDTDWAQGILARCRALLSADGAAEELYGTAVERLSRTSLRPELARAHLLYGEWLRGQNRTAEALGQLRTAHDMFASMGLEAFADRTHRELRHAGATVPRRPGASPSGAGLTPQEQQIAALVREGLSNPEVGARLFLSPRTVEWHLRKIFTKAGVSSRRQLRDMLPREVPTE
jgi:DNA-binding CsgD family transcriptional regulator